MSKPNLQTLRAAIETGTYAKEDDVLAGLIALVNLSAEDRRDISARAAGLVRQIRASSKPGLMEVFLAEYGLSTDEGVALMCLAEALLRVPDAETIDALIEDKIAPSDWGRHLGHSSSTLVNASTWALMLTGRVLEDSEPGLVGTLRGAVKRLGEPVIRTAVGRAMKEMGRQFVLGETIQSAMSRATEMEDRGFTYSYDMLGEAARTDADARRYFDAYARSIAEIAKSAPHADCRKNPGISIKLSALHPRYEVAQTERVMSELVPRLRDLALSAKAANIGLNVDAEEADRLSLSLDVIEAVLREPVFAGWDGFGIVVQAYGRRAGPVLDWIYALAEAHDRKVMVRLVKGAYWDTEIKHAQVLGLPEFPVFTRKTATDVSYIANARRLLAMTDRIYPQFATHNAHTTAAILHMAGVARDFEFQKLHGMGDRLHDILMETSGAGCRIYAPVGAHRDLLAYLVRRLLENGANSSFVNQIVDVEVAPETVAADPFDALDGDKVIVRRGTDIFLPERRNSQGWDLADRPTLDAIDAARGEFSEIEFAALPRIAVEATPLAPRPVFCPSNPDLTVGTVADASETDVAAALDAARPWDADVAERGKVLNRVADLYEAHYGALFALLAREAGKSLPDAVSELREAVDFLRYYAAQAQGITRPALGRVACISPWNFPLAIFTGQITGALATGNAVLAKPAEQTPLIADYAVSLMHEAGVPRDALQLLPGDGATVGAALASDPRIDGVVFTGSTDTAKIIRRSMAKHGKPGAPLIAETGGLNAMIVDSTALAEQAVGDIVQSAFQSAGQRCSALRCLYLQADIAPGFRKMLFGAMDALSIGDPWNLSTDVGPAIDGDAQRGILDYLAATKADGRLEKQLSVPKTGHFVPPSVISVPSIQAMEREIFGPVLHIATFEAEEIDRVIGEINASGYGLTFGLHTRIDDRVQHLVEALNVGNIYVNRNQIGAVVGSQPFGGEGLSGTGPKAGGPDYLIRLTRDTVRDTDAAWRSDETRANVTRAIAMAQPDQPTGDAHDLPGPTGESNRLSRTTRAPFLCLGPGIDAARQQAEAVQSQGGQAAMVKGRLDPATLTDLQGIGGAIWWGDEASAAAYDLALAARPGAILPLLRGGIDRAHVTLERHVCVDTTASGGNAQLLAEVSAA